MILRCTSFEKMEHEIKEQNASIVIFGAGAVGAGIVPEILAQYRLFENIICYIDNSQGAQQQGVWAKEKFFTVRPVEELAHIKGTIIVMIAISRYADALEQIQKLACSEHLICYIMPMMCIHNFCRNISRGKAVLKTHPLIPKKIHYMWLGGKDLPPNFQKCLESWQKYCPDYEIIFWNESNYNIAKHPYMKEAYDAGGYGFVPDYARLDILYHYGGIYMDTDVELIRPLDSLLYQEAFCGVEKWQVVNFGGCSGAVKRNPAIGEFLNRWKDIRYVMEDGRLNRYTCGYYDTQTALAHGYQLNGETQHIMGMNIYASDYFHPFDYMSGRMDKTEHTYSIHHFNGGWLDEKTREATRETARKYECLYQKAKAEGGYRNLVSIGKNLC